MHPLQGRKSSLAACAHLIQQEFVELEMQEDLDQATSPPAPNRPPPKRRAGKTEYDTQGRKSSLIAAATIIQDLNKPQRRGGKSVFNTDGRKASLAEAAAIIQELSKPQRRRGKTPVNTDGRKSSMEECAELLQVVATSQWP